MSRLLAPYRIPDARRESMAAFVNGIRGDVDGWRAQGYPGITETTRRLLTHWFETDHQQPYYFCQREAIETLIYLYEVRRLRRMSQLAETYNEAVASRASENKFARYVFKMATGSGKTKVMSLAIVWSYFNAVFHPETRMPKTFLLIAPNVIVYERLVVDFEDGRIFRTDPLIPAEWKSAWQFSVITRDDPGHPTTEGALFVTNVHRLYEGRGGASADEPPEMAAVLGPVVKGEASGAEELRERIVGRGPLFVLNDEGHHLHNEELKWRQIIDGLHDELDGGLAGQLDFTATPKHTDGKLFREIVVDYPIAQAVEDGIVKTPVIGELTGAEDYQSADAAVRFRDRINAGIEKWRDFEEALKDDPTKKPLLFIMAENTESANQIADYLQTLEGFWGRVLNIHTNAKGEVVEGKTKAKKEEINLLRTEARKVDGADNPYAAIVSVLMLREGWDVRNVCVIVPLRPYTAKANILPEQTLGRGLRRMTPPASGDVLEQVVVIEHAAFKDFWKRELEEEGLQIEWVPVDKVRPIVKTVVVDPTRVDRYGIDVPLLTPMLVRSVAKLDELSVPEMTVDPLELPDPKTLRDEKIEYTGRHMFTGEIVEIDEFDKEFPVEPSGYISMLVKLIEKETRITGQFAKLAPLVKELIETRLFGKPASMEDEVVMRVLNRPEAKIRIFMAFVTAINDVSIEVQNVGLEQQWLRVSSTNPFTTSRPTVEGRRTVFNLVPCDRSLETDFANFLESPGADDVLAYFKNETAVHFDVEYQSVRGGIRHYRPDFVVRCGDGCMYVVETKGLEDLEVPQKDARMDRWCEDASALTGQTWRYLKVPEGMFRAYPVRRFGDLVRALS